jgi:hypothetical protein
MEETRLDDVPQVSDEENAILTTPYSDEEVKKCGFSDGTQQSAMPRFFF